MPSPFPSAPGNPAYASSFNIQATWSREVHTLVTWNKRTGPCPFGPYQVFTEHILFGYRGRAVFERSALGKLQTCFTETPILHCDMPNSFYQDIAWLFPGPRLDVFARQVREGYDGWGNEYGSIPVDLNRRPKKARSWT